MFPDRYFDWHRIYADEHRSPPVVDCRRRLRYCFVGFLLLLGVVFARLVHLEVTQGAAFRAEAAKPLVRRQHLPGVRGRILTSSGTVLAYDKKVLGLAVHYRYLEQPADPRWLRSTARSREPGKERKDPSRLAAEEAKIRNERQELAQRLAKLSGLSAHEWDLRARRIQARVERIAETVNRRRSAGFSGHTANVVRHGRQPDSGKPHNFARRIGGVVLEVLRDEPDPRDSAPITVAEELDYHVIVEDLALEVVAEIEGHPQVYPGVEIVERHRRAYPQGTLAAHVLGHLGPVEEGELAGSEGPLAYHPEDRLGRMGLELKYESLLRGRGGVAVERSDRSGHVLSTHQEIEAGVGRDLIVTLDPKLQQTSEALLDSVLERRMTHQLDPDPAGGAIVVMDIHTGAILVAASGPRFDPNLFAHDGAKGVDALLTDAANPLFDRTTKMAVPPGSVFKIVTAAALLESDAVDPDEPVMCQGYLETPSRWRCAIYRNRGEGHGEVDLSDALCQSCNVYFFQHAGSFDPESLVGWALEFGFGQRTGIDLPGESAGTVPTPLTIGGLEGHRWRAADTRLLAIGQSSLETTPLQIARMMAAVANGGLLVTPHVVTDLGLTEDPRGDAAEDSEDDPLQVPPPRRIADLTPPTLAIIRAALERVVADPHGTAHAAVHMATLPIAGKTGTAETGLDDAEHAWFAAYLPADEPEFALVVALEHAGNASDTACPVGKRLALEMQEMGCFHRGRPQKLAPSGQPSDSRQREPAERAVGQAFQPARSETAGKKAEDSADRNVCPTEVQ